MKKMLLCLTLIFFCLTSVGCWDIHDISNRALITAIGIDKVEETSTSYTFTFEIINPVNIIEEHHETANIIETVEGTSLREAMEKLQVKVSRLNFLGYLQVVLIGENAGRKSVKDISDMIFREPQIASRTRLMFVQDGEAKDILEAKPKLAKYVAAELVAMTQLEYELSLARNQTFYQFLNELRSTDGRGFVSRVLATENNKTIVRDGGAVFNNWELIDWLSSEETQAANWLVGKSDATVVGHLDQGIFTYRSDEKKLKIKPLKQGEGPRVQISLHTNGQILSKQGSNMELTRPGNLKKLEKLFSDVIANQIRSAVQKSQAAGVDYLGIGTAVKGKNPKLYQSMEWEKAYPTIPIDVIVTTEIEDVGLLE
ncbi:Ger(x)C family spore germination protein [Dehalobacterium formicoaceticum]|uniref:Ger(X)C family spore germination protein n=1 Tax=Dehalobacterium formicoaceticum TaxID=51515 RepID=A0ABT1Y980_9FIRM|nr:Ger(x)C family spore germination protein [Dehalobacterium formicoaceticum]MCR6546474.1 Ger(x)C family spore germination protein [Dehalobacterium formicoaceticum]